MCLDITQTEKLEKQKVVFVIRRMRNNKPTSPFMGIIWKIRKLYTLKDNKKISKHKFLSKTIAKGVYHCLEYENIAIYYLKRMKNVEAIGDYYIYKAIIPAGTWIAHGIIPKGYVGAGLGSMATRAIKMTKKVSKWSLVVKYAYYQGTNTDTGSSSTGGVIYTGSPIDIEVIKHDL